MPIVDAHVHSSPLWYEPVESLLYQMDSQGVSKAVLVPFTGHYSGYEIECARRYPGRFAPLTIVDVQRPDALDRLEDNALKGAVGVRIGIHDPFPGKDPLALWRQAARLGLNVSCHGAIDLFATEAFRETVAEFPGLKIVLEHLAGASRSKRFPNPDHRLFDRVLALADYPHVYVKLPGFGEILARRYPMAAPVFEAPRRRSNWSTTPSDPAG